MNYPDDFINKIICGDCLEVMKDIPDDAVDMVFTSPPFKEEDVDGDYWEQYDLWFKEIERVSKYCFGIIHSATKINYLAQHYPPKRWMIWGKGIVVYAWRFNPILFYQKADCKVNKYIYFDTIGITPIIGSKKIHKYQDPLNLYEAIIKMFPYTTVLDPFMGSGTTALACKKLNKNYIGIEQEIEYVNLSNQRLAEI
jgi:site-specific DNA-methyltransferase (adenine-specific)